MVRTPVATVRTLMRGLVDYAGLFPPAAREMSGAVARYDAHRRSDDAWMLGRFVVPEAALSELAAEVQRLPVGPVTPWRVSAIVGAESGDVATRIGTFNAAHRERLVVDVAELRPMPAARIADALRGMPSNVTSYVEVPIRDDPSSTLAVIGTLGARAKVRTGGVTRDAFPRVEDLVRFIRGCAEMNIPFKATAGLHHPFAGDHPLTYASDAPRGTMFGFVNVFAAAAFARVGMSDAMLRDVAREPDALALEFHEHTMRWRAHVLELEQLAEARESFAISFGSCSFSEPVDELRALGLL
ncbi:MAG: hypothetical protein ABIP93_21310 [Gemmatimonadaceae bacterium]